MKESYANIGNLSQDTSFPASLSDYEKSFNNLYFVGVCKEFIEDYKKEQCNDQLLRSGLETIAIYILENSKKNLMTFNFLRKSEFAAKSLLNSIDVIQLGNQNN